MKLVTHGLVWWNHAARVGDFFHAISRLHFGTFNGPKKRTPFTLIVKTIDKFGARAENQPVPLGTKARLRSVAFEIFTR